MLSCTLALAALLLQTPQAPTEAASDASTRSSRPNAGLDWYQGTLAEALAELEGSEACALVLCTMEQDAWSAKLERVSLADERVIAAAGGMLCVRLDVHGKEGQAITQKHSILRLPTLLFLEADGSPRDVYLGYLGPRFLAAEIARVAADEGTISSLKKRLEAGAASLDDRYALARKLVQVGDRSAAHDIVETIRALDPERTSRASRRLALDETVRDVQQMRTPTDEPIRALLAKEEDPGILYAGWSWIFRVRGFLATMPPDPEEAAAHAARGREAARKAWSSCPPPERVLFGSELAWTFHQWRERLTPEERDFAIAVAEEVARIDPADPDALDALVAGLLLAGRLDEARTTLQRCATLDPGNDLWRSREAELELAAKALQESSTR